jgi:hypothetical protein
MSKTKKREEHKFRNRLYRRIHGRWPERVAVDRLTYDQWPYERDRADRARRRDPKRGAPLVSDERALSELVDEKSGVIVMPTDSAEPINIVDQAGGLPAPGS